MIPSWLIFGTKKPGGLADGEKGDQQVTRPEVGLLLLIAAGTLLATAATVRDYREGIAVANVLDAATGLDARRLAVLYFEDRSARRRIGCSKVSDAAQVKRGRALVFS